MSRSTKFLPDWINTPPKAKSFRSIFKYGDPSGFKHPNERMYEELKRRFQLTDDHFKQKKSTGNEMIDIEKPVGIAAHHIAISRKTKTLVSGVVGGAN